jgi:hypothetical protein
MRATPVARQRLTRAARRGLLWGSRRSDGSGELVNALIRVNPTGKGLQIVWWCRASRQVPSRAARLALVLVPDPTLPRGRGLRHAVRDASVAGHNPQTGAESPHEREGRLLLPGRQSNIGNEAMVTGRRLPAALARRRARTIYPLAPVR